MILGITPRFMPQRQNILTKNSNTSFGQANLASELEEALPMQISPKVEVLLKKACNKIKYLISMMDPVEKAYEENHPELALKLLKAKDVYNRPVTFALLGDEQSKSFVATHFPVEINVKNGIAKISAVKAGEKADTKDPNKYLEWALEAICAK